VIWQAGFSVVCDIFAVASPSFIDLEESVMSLTTEALHKFSLRRRIVAIAILSTGVGWASANTLSAQEASPAVLHTTTRSNSWSLEGVRSNTAPYLVISLAERRQSNSYSSLPLAGDETANLSVMDGVSRSGGLVDTANPVDKGKSGPQLLSRLFAPSSSTDSRAALRAGGITARGTFAGSSHPAGDNIYTLLDEGSRPGSFQYAHQANILASIQRLADESFPREATETTRPLLQLQLGGWSFPVILSGTAYPQ